jgi:hypothetical protein
MLGRTSRGSSTGSVPEERISPALRRAQEMLLAAVAEGGTARLAHICLDAWDGGDTVAAGMTLGALLRALTGMGPITAHEILAHLHADGATRVGELDHAQRGALPTALARARRPRTSVPD